MNFQKISPCNSRILYSEAQGPLDDWFSAFGPLKNFIENEPQISVFSGDIYLYFFLPPDDEFFLESDIWIALEVIGFIDLEDNEDFGIYDLEKGDVYSFELPFKELAQIDLATLSEFEMEARSKLKGEIELASTWRIKIQEKGQGKYALSIQFFPLSEEALN